MKPINQINLKERSIENIKALAYDILKTLEYYRGVLNVIEVEIGGRTEAETPEELQPTEVLK